MITYLRPIVTLCDDIKVQHTVFALPFAIISVFLASDGAPSAYKTFWIVVAMAGARTSAMLFNRIVDADIDKMNPRTKRRALPSGAISKNTYYIFLLFSICIFLLACNYLNRLCLYLAPIALLIIFFYSYTKRFTIASHFFLGLALSLAPIGGWIAVREEISFAALLLGVAVVFWLAGLDIIYSCQDVEFDSKNNLWSFPRRFGIKRALRFSGLFHCCMVIILLSLLFLKKLGVIYMAGVALTAGLLLYEHTLVSSDSLENINIAFFNINGIISVFLMIVVITDCYI